MYKFACIFTFNTCKVFIVNHQFDILISQYFTSSNSRCITNQVTAMLSPINLDLKHSLFKGTVTRSQRRQNPREKIILSCWSKIIVYLAKNKFSRKKYIFSSIPSSSLQENCYLFARIKSLGKKKNTFNSIVQNYYLFNCEDRILLWGKNKYSQR